MSASWVTTGYIGKINKAWRDRLAFGDRKCCANLGKSASARSSDIRSSLWATAAFVAGQAQSRQSQEPESPGQNRRGSSERYVVRRCDVRLSASRSRSFA